MSEIHFQRIGSKHLLSPPSLVLTYNGNKCLINVGENVQRYCFEHKIRLSRLRNILLTNISVETIGGLPGLLLTLIGVGVQKLRIVGPEPITQYLLMFGYIIRTQKRYEHSMNTVLSINSQEFLDNFDGVKSDLEIEVVQLMPSSSSEPFKLELDHELFLECYLNHSFSVSQTCVDFEGNKRPNSKKRCTENSSSCLSNPSILYIFEFPEKRGKFDVIKAKELGIPPGPLYSKLKNGESVQISDSRIIQPNDVCSPPIKLPWSIIFHALHPTDFDYFYFRISQILISKGFDFTEGTLDSNNCSDGHESFSNFYIFQFQAYFDSLLDSNPNSLKLDSCFIQNKHYLSKGIIKVERLNERLSSLREQEINPFMTSHFLQEFLNHISPSLFPLSSAKVDELSWNQQFFISSNQKSLQNTVSIANIHKKRTKFAPISQESEDQILFLKQEFQDIFSNSIEKYPKLLFPLLYVLGTGSAIPSPYRNVSGCLLRLDDNTSMMLDCGEGSMSQLFTLCKFDFDLFSKIIASIKIVFISHPHEDHFLGILNLLKLKNSVNIQQKVENVSESTQNDNFCHIKYHQNLQQVEEICFNSKIKNRDFKNLVIIGPRKVEKLYNLFQEKITQDKGNKIKNCEISFIAIEKRINGNSGNISDQSQLLIDDFFLKLEQFPVKHIKSSYGTKVTIRLENKVEKGQDCSLFKIVFSGDTATPCKSLEDASKDCDILIHEATFEDSLSKDAQEKNHSTISGAIRTAYNSLTKFLLLTHFSQRYFSMPKVEMKNEHLNKYFLNNTLCMMDLMIIPLQRVGKLIERFHDLNDLIRDYLPQV